MVTGMATRTAALDARPDDVFTALADPTRRAVVEQLGRGPAATSTLAGHFDMALPSFMAHLDLLGRSGLVTSDQAGAGTDLPARARRPGAGRALARRPAPVVDRPPRPARHLPHQPRRGPDMTDTQPNTASAAPNPECDLVLERVVPVSPELVLAAWTEPERIVQWFTPAPWKTTDAEVDLRPGGIFRTVHGVARRRHRQRRLRLRPRLRARRAVRVHRRHGPRLPSQRRRDAVHRVHHRGPRGRRLPLHRHRAARHAGGRGQTHAEMGFHDGWGAALDQLVGIWGH